MPEMLAYEILDSFMPDPSEHTNEELIEMLETFRCALGFAANFLTNTLHRIDRAQVKELTPIDEMLERIKNDFKKTTKPTSH